MKAVNYANQIKEQSNNLVNGLVDNKSNNDSEECFNIFNIETGSYEVIYDYFEDVSLMKDNKILYKLDDYHGKKILINLAPANIRKEGSCFDLAMAVRNISCYGENYKI